MAKKKAVKKSYGNYVIVAAAVLICLVVISLPVLKNLADINSGSLVKIAGQTVSPGEFKLNVSVAGASYSYFGEDVWGWEMDENGTTMWNYLSNQVLSKLMDIKIANSHAGELGVSLSPDDKAMAKEKMSEFRDAIDDETAKYIGLSEKKMNKMFEELTLSDKVYEHVTKDYVFVDADFDAYMEDYYNDNRRELVTVTLDFLETDTPEAAEEARERAIAGESLNDLALSMDTGEREDGYESIVAGEYGLPVDVEDAAFSLSPGDVSEVMSVAPNEEDGPDRFFVIQVLSVEEPDMDELRQEQKEVFINNEKSDIFEAQLVVWRSLAEDSLYINRPLLATITPKFATYKETGDIQYEQEILDLVE